MVATIGTSTDGSSGTGSSSNSSQIKNLQARLEKYQEQLANDEQSTTSSNSSSAATKQELETEIANIQAQIAQLNANNLSQNSAVSQQLINTSSSNQHTTSSSSSNSKDEPTTDTSLEDAALGNIIDIRS